MLPIEQLKIVVKRAVEESGIVFYDDLQHAGNFTNRLLDKIRVHFYTQCGGSFLTTLYVPRDIYITRLPDDASVTFLTAIQSEIIKEYYLKELKAVLPIGKTELIIALGEPNPGNAFGKHVVLGSY